MEKMNKGFIPYIGSKNKIISLLSKKLHATGKQCLVDVFGGSGSVTLRSGFSKRIYNDVNSDMVNLFRVMSDPKSRMKLLKQLKWCPPSREIYNSERQLHLHNNHSFGSVGCSVTRARMTFYRHIYAFGGKIRTGGFIVSTSDRNRIKEIMKYSNVLRKFSEYGAFFSETVIEHLDFSLLIKKYGDRDNVVLFVDPPYPGFDTYYSNNLSMNQHFQLANILLTVAAPVICTFYDHSLVRKLYPAELWDYEIVKGLKNYQQGGNKTIDELFLTRKYISVDALREYQKDVNLQQEFKL
jgi:DNA adenine methylase